MGFRGLSLGTLLVVLVIALLVLGTKRLRSLGEDLGAALKGFRQGLRDNDKGEKCEKSEKSEKNVDDQ